MKARPGGSPLFEFPWRFQTGLDFRHVRCDQLRPAVGELARAFEVETDLDAFGLVGEADFVVDFRRVEMDLEPDEAHAVGARFAQVSRQRGESAFLDECHELGDAHAGHGHRFAGDWRGVK